MKREIFKEGWSAGRNGREGWPPVTLDRVQAGWWLDGWRWGRLAYDGLDNRASADCDFVQEYGSG